MASIASRAFAYSHKYVHVDLLYIAGDTMDNYMTDLINYERARNGDIPAVINGGIQVGILTGAPKHLVVDLIVDPNTISIFNFTDHIISTGTRSRTMTIAFEAQYTVDVVDAEFEMNSLDAAESARVRNLMANVLVGNLQIWGSLNGIEIVTGKDRPTTGGGGSSHGPGLVKHQDTIR